MSSTARIHFSYVIGILVAIIILLITWKSSDNAQLVGYVSFALTLSSIFLALIAIIYAFVSNSTLAQHVGGLYQASTGIRDSANTLERLTTSLESKVVDVSAKVEATHDLVRALSNPENPPIDQESEELQPRNELIDRLVQGASQAGVVAMYSAAVAYRLRRTFMRDDLMKFLDPGHEHYYYGWLMALDATGILDVRGTSREGGRLWTIDSYSPRLLEQIEAEAETAPDESDTPPGWSKEKVKAIQAYFTEEGTA